MTVAIPRRTGVPDTYSAEVERLRRLELWTGGAAFETDWAILPNSSNSVYWRVTYGLVLLAGEIVGTDLVEPGWRLVGTLLEPLAWPPVEHVVPAWRIPTASQYVSPLGATLPNEAMPTVARPDGYIVRPDSFSVAPTSTVPTWAYSLASSYFPLG